MACEQLLARMNELQVIERSCDRAAHVSLIFQETEEKLAEILGRCTTTSQTRSFKGAVLEKCIHFADNQEFPLLAASARSLRDTILALNALTDMATVAVDPIIRAQSVLQYFPRRFPVLALLNDWSYEDATLTMAATLDDSTLEWLDRYGGPPQKEPLGILHNTAGRKLRNRTVYPPCTIELLKNIVIDSVDMYTIATTWEPAEIMRIRTSL